MTSVGDTDLVQGVNEISGDKLKASSKVLPIVTLGLPNYVDWLCQILAFGEDPPPPNYTQSYQQNYNASHNHS